MNRQSTRWRLIVRRSLMFVVTLLVAHQVLGHAARWIANRSVEAAVAAKVEVADASVSLLDRQVILDGLRMANPNHPTASLLQAERCELDFAVAPILYKQAIIDRGRVAGLMIGARACKAGAGSTTHRNSPNDHWIAPTAGEPARQWLAALNAHFQNSPEVQFESLARSEALGTRWPGECNALKQRGAELKRQAIGLQQATESAEANRLRHAAFFSELPGHVASLRRKSAEYGAEIDRLSMLLEAERRQIVAARQRDEQMFSNRLTLKPIDSGAMSAYLLREQLAQPLDELIGWLRWARQVVPAPTEASAEAKRGEDILFGGRRMAPNFMIRALQLQGAAQIGGQSIEIVGQLTDVTNAPSHHNAPIRLRLTGAGTRPFDLQATIDRTGNVLREELLVDCRSIAVQELRLGDADQLEIEIAPSPGSLSISVTVEGDKLAGDIQLVQKSVRILSVIHVEPSDINLTAPLQAALSNMNSTATRISLGGTLAKPSCTIWSNLGPAVAEAMGQVAQKASEQRAQKVLAAVRQQVDERLADLERQLAQERTELAAELAGIADQLELIVQRQAPRERLSTEQLGRRLPSNSLFR